MYLTGAGGTGKNHVIFTSYSVCKESSSSLQVMFGKYSLRITSCTGSVDTLLLYAMEIYKGAHLNYRRITDEFREEWDFLR